MNKLILIIAASCFLISCQKNYPLTNNNLNQKGVWSNYFKETIKQPPHKFIHKIDSLLQKDNNSIGTILDLGAGAGVNIKNLIKKNFNIYAYDADPESIDIINYRFRYYIEKGKLITTLAKFENIKDLPKSDAIIAWKTLPFMSKQKFPDFWQRIHKTIRPGGYFVGTFFGKKHYTKRSKKSPSIFRLSRKETENLFKNYQIIYWHEIIEYDKKSSESWKSDQYRHIYQILAQKKIIN